MPQNKQPKLVRISEKLQQNMQYVDELMGLETNFDIIHRVIRLGDTDACMYLIDGFCKDELMQKILQYLMDLKAEDFPKDAHEMSKIAIPYVEVDLDDTWEKILGALLSGVFVLLLDGYEKAVLIDARTYPTRGVEEPDKDKVLRGSKDGFVETVVFNTALIRRRIRSTDLHMEMLNAGENSRTDIVLCYMESRVDPKLLTQIRGTDPFHSGGCSGHESGKPGGMSVPAEVVQSVSEVQIHGAAGYGGSPGAGRQSGDPGGQFPFCHDPAHHDL